MLYEVETMRVIFETVRNLFQPLSYLLAVVILVMYEFSVLGMFMFGGDVQTNSPAILVDASLPPYYYLVNFNDLISSFVTLFILMIVNNWYVVVQQFVDVKNGILLYRIYFIIFYYFGVIIGLNIVVAFAIDMYSAVKRLDHQR